jgi:hypothetical protein
METSCKSEGKRGILKVSPVKHFTSPMKQPLAQIGSVGSLINASDSSIEGKDNCLEDYHSSAELERTTDVTPRDASRTTDPALPADNTSAEGSTSKDSESSRSLTHLHDADSPNRKKVSFSTLETREYLICIGDNPCVTLGTPITLDWAHGGEILCSVEEYEEHRPPPRTMAQLRIPSQCRNDMLKRIGYSRRDIMDGAKHATIAHNRRKRTIETLGLAAAEEFLELVRRATMNATIRCSAKRKERELLEPYYKPV